MRMAPGLEIVIRSFPALARAVVIFYSAASTNLVSGVASKGINLFWRDLQVGKTYAVTSVGIADPVNGNPSTSTAGSVMTPDGRYVFFIAPWLSSLSTAALYVWDALSGANVYTNIASSSALPSFLSDFQASPDGHWVRLSGKWRALRSGLEGRDKRVYQRGSVGDSLRPTI